MVQQIVGRARAARGTLLNQIEQRPTVHAHAPFAHHREPARLGAVRLGKASSSTFAFCLNF